MCNSGTLLLKCCLQVSFKAPPLSLSNYMCTLNQLVSILVNSLGEALHVVGETNMVLRCPVPEPSGDTHTHA